MTRNNLIYGFGLLLSAYLLFQSCQGEQAIRMAQYAVNGQKIYVTQCQNCHGAKGEGLGGLYPPLTDSSFLIAHRRKLPCIVKNGLSGPIQLQGKTFDAPMPPNPQLTPIDVAYVLTYIGNSFGNKLGLFTLDEVQSILDSCKNQSTR